MAKFRGERDEFYTGENQYPWSKIKPSITTHAIFIQYNASLLQ